MNISSFIWQLVKNAEEYSRDTRPVACIAVSNNKLVSVGFNDSALNMPTRDENKKTLPTVIHAEVNCLINYRGSDEIILYCSYAPCVNCASAIIQSGIVKEVWYKELLNDNKAGVRLLRKAGIKCNKRR
ncbi:deaminase [uncultured Campylobacter sp.]|uniref:deaminase n=1 Tax=uncultured Campylobacter sp. TaxID=218934 RepID=UPI00262F2125|nr:deaminase [uncultured Campylobacter sp.]